MLLQQLQGQLAFTFAFDIRQLSLEIQLCQHMQAVCAVPPMARRRLIAGTLRHVQLSKRTLGPLLLRFQGTACKPRQLPRLLPSVPWLPWVFPLPRPLLFCWPFFKTVQAAGCGLQAAAQPAWAPMDGILRASWKPPCVQAHSRLRYASLSQRTGPFCAH